MMLIDPAQISNILLIITAWSGAFIVALWMSLIIWAYRDIRARARDPLARILAVLVVAVLSIPGLVIYLIIRPPRTLEVEYQQTLEEEALLQSIEDVPVCPGCSRRIQTDWVICPSCHTKLKKPCLECGRLMELPWNLCPYCSNPVPGMRRDEVNFDEALKSLSPESESAEDLIKNVEIEADRDAHLNMEPIGEPIQPDTVLDNIDPMVSHES